MRRSLYPFRPLDALIIAGCLAAALLSLPALKTVSPATVAVYRDNVKIAEYPLAVARTVSVAGKIGTLTFSIDDRSVRVVKADCPEQICVRTGRIRRGGQQIICAPNHLLIELVAPSRKAVDAVTQ